MGSHSGEINISHYFSYEDNSVGYPTQVRYFWDYCTSVNIIFKKARAKSNSRRQGKSSKGAELQKGTFFLKMKVEIAKLVV